MDKQLASGPPAPAKCDFKVGHVNERDRFTTTGLGTLLSAAPGGGGGSGNGSNGGWFVTWG